MEETKEELTHFRRLMDDTYDHRIPLYERRKPNEALPSLSLVNDVNNQEICPSPRRFSLSDRQRRKMEVKKAMEMQKEIPSHSVRTRKSNVTSRDREKVPFQRINELSDNIRRRKSDIMDLALQISYSNQKTRGYNSDSNKGQHRSTLPFTSFRGEGRPENEFSGSRSNSRARTLIWRERHEGQTSSSLETHLSSPPPTLDTENNFSPQSSFEDIGEREPFPDSVRQSGIRHLENKWKSSLSFQSPVTQNSTERRELYAKSMSPRKPPLPKLKTSNSVDSSFFVDIKSWDDSELKGPVLRKSFSELKCIKEDVRKLCSTLENVHLDLQKLALSQGIQTHPPKCCGNTQSSISNIQEEVLKVKETFHNSLEEMKSGIQIR